MRKKPPIPIPVTSRERFIELGVPLQKIFEQEFKKLPEFDFYQTSPNGEPPKGLQTIVAVVDKKGNPVPKHEYEDYVSHYSQYKFMLYDKDEEDRPTDKLFDIKRLFMQTREQAKQAEWVSNFKEAARLYEWLISQEYPLPYAYDRLIKIYKDHKQFSDAVDVANEGITFFTDLRARQIKYVGRLAEKYGVIDFFLDRVVGKQKVFYYGGSFELYNPYPIIDKWKDKLIKLQTYAQ